MCLPNGTKRPCEIANAAMRHARSHGNDVVIVDTAGRLAVDERHDG